MTLQSALVSYSLGLTATIALCVSSRTQFSEFTEDFREEFGLNSKNMPA